MGLEIGTTYLGINMTEDREYGIRPALASGSQLTSIYRRYNTVSLRDTRGYDLAADLPGLLRIDFDTEIDLLLLLSP